MSPTLHLTVAILLTITIAISLTFFVERLRKVFYPTQKELEKQLLAKKGRKGYPFDLRRYDYKRDHGYSQHQTLTELHGAWGCLQHGPAEDLSECKCIIHGDDDHTYIIDQPISIQKSDDKISLSFVIDAVSDVLIVYTCAVTKENRYLGEVTLTLDAPRVFTKGTLGPVKLPIQLRADNRLVFTYTMRF